MPILIVAFVWRQNGRFYYNQLRTLIINDMKKTAMALFLVFGFRGLYAQQNTDPKAIYSGISDSVSIAVHKSYDRVSGIHRWFFGENYRKEWAATVKIPLVDVAKVNGGLTPEQFGGGMETKSIRMKDKTGKEWVIRSVEKVPDKLLPENLRQTFALDWVADEYSGQHPYSALMVPPLAEAAHVPHAHPVIGVLMPNAIMGTFSNQFAGRVVLLEEREPTGESENTLKMLKELTLSHNNRIDGDEFLRARMLDLLLGDWDRHEDQWRWTKQKNGKDLVYMAVPRDRDQVLHVDQGLFPSLAALPWIDPVLGDFGGTIPNVKYSLFKTRFIQRYPDAQFNYQHWMDVVNGFVKDETDEVLEASVKCLPEATYKIRGKEILAQLKERRNNIPAAMDQYFRFINRIVDIRASDKNEFVEISDGPDSAMRIVMTKLAKNGRKGDPIMDVSYLPSITKEIRLYMEDGSDHLVINTHHTPVKLRIIDSAGHKAFDIRSIGRTISLYAVKDSTTITGNAGKISTHFSNDTLNTRFVATNPYNLWTPLATGAINRDDGFLLDLGFRYTGRDGFRKLPYSTIQDVMLTHSFETKAFRVYYDGQWMQAAGRADITLYALAEAPDNTMNFFGEGNNTILNKTADYHEFYRSRFDLYQLDPALRWHLSKSTAFSFGPSFQYYHVNPADNYNRSVNQPGLITSYDSTNFDKDKLHLGLMATLQSDKRNSKILPSSGYYLNIRLEGYAGLNQYSKSFTQLRPEFTYYQKVDSSASLVFSDRVGGGVGIGNPAFYQSFFLGGQGNLLGYLQNRFAGQQMAFNDLQVRLRLANIAGYILPGQLGVTGFFDTGRVWIKGEDSNTWHNGTGAGIYFAPASLTVIQIIAGHSNEGWYPYITFNFTI
jgi:hypothetical protein